MQGDCFLALVLFATVPHSPWTCMLLMGLLCVFSSVSISISVSISVAATVAACFVNYIYLYECVLLYMGTFSMLFGAQKYWHKQMKDNSARLRMLNEFIQNDHKRWRAGAQCACGATEVTERIIDFASLRDANMHVSLDHKHSFHNVIKQHLHISECDCW